MDRSPIKITVTREQANAQARNLMRIAERQGRKLSLVQALDEVAEINGYRNMHEQKAAYATPSVPTCVMKSIPELVEAIDCIAKTSPAFAQIARRVSFHMDARVMSPFFIEKGMPGIGYNPSLVRGMTPSSIAYGIAMMLYLTLMQADVRKPEGGDQRCWIAAWNMAAHLALSGFFERPACAYDFTSFTTAIGKPIAGMTAEQIYEELLAARDRIPELATSVPMPEDDRIYPDLRTAMVESFHAEERKQWRGMLAKADDATAPTATSCTADELVEVIAESKRALGAPGFLAIVDDVPLSVARLAGAHPEVTVVAWDAFAADPDLQERACRQALTRSTIIVTDMEPALPNGRDGATHAAMRLIWLRIA